VVVAAGQREDVVLRITPATFLLETAAEQPFDVLAWLRAAGGASYSASPSARTIGGAGDSYAKELLWRSAGGTRV
jgi:hypothetical protein